MQTESRKHGTALICSCCRKPFAYLQHGRLVITSRHDSQTHTNTLSVHELRMVLVELENRATVEGTANSRQPSAVS